MAQAADVLKFARLVEGAQKGGLDMPRVARELHEQAAGGGEKPGALSQDKVDAVRIMTVHASKGLEFPIVAVANCYVPSNRTNAPTTLSCGQKVYAALLPKGFSPSDVDGDDEALQRSTDLGTYASLLKKANSDREYAERKRLFYVAATRASDALIVAVKHRATKKGTLPGVESDLVNGLFPDETAFPEASAAFDYGGSRPGAYTVVPMLTAEEEDEGEGAVHAQPAVSLRVPSSPLPGALAARGALQPASMRSDFFSYTSLAASRADAGASGADAANHSRKGAAIAPTDSFACSFSAGWGAGSYSGTDADLGANDTAPDAGCDLDEEALFRIDADPDKATAFGSALHQACEWLALRGLDHADDCDLERIAAQWGVHDMARLRYAFEGWRSSDTCAEAFAYPIVQPELPFCVPADEGFLEGSIDLFCENGSGEALVVDYKTGGSPEETPEHLQAKHLLQAQCYAYAVLSAGYSRVTLRFVRVERAQSVSYAFTASDLPALERAIVSPAATRQ